MRRLVAALALLLAVPACSAPPEELPFDAGVEVDAGPGPLDAGSVDAGVDAGRPDAGPVDAGAPDAGPGPVDAGQPWDAGSVPDATQTVTLQVPTALRSSPFDVARTLRVPPGFSVELFARVTSARFMAFAPNGELLVSQPGGGKVFALKESGGVVTSRELLSGLRKGHDLVFDVQEGVSWLYVAESHQVSRREWKADNTLGTATVVVADLPDSSTAELRGAYGHELKNIAIDPQHRLYVSVASTCNVCTTDDAAPFPRAAMHRYSATGGNHEVIHRGLRNAEGLAFVPGTSDLWVVVNNRDNMHYPFDDGTGRYGQIQQSYVDDHPPEEFTFVREGGHTGWPWCNPDLDHATNGMVELPFVADWEFNRGGTAFDCSRADRVKLGIQAHSAPLGLTFLVGTNFPAPFRQAAVAGLHGSWNRATKTGYKVALFPWDPVAQRPVKQLDLISGFVDTTTNSAWGRPVDVAVDAQGRLYVSDDQAGAIYRLRQD